MRKLMAIFAISVLSVSTPSWALFGLGDINFDGSLEVSGNSANNEVSFSPANDHRGATATRVRVGMNAQVTEGVSSRLEVARTPASAGSTESQYGGTGKPTSVASEEGNFVIHNAFIKLEELWGHTVVLGRQYVGDSGDLVWYIGPKSDDSLTVTSIDGILAYCNKGEEKGNFMDKVKLTLFTGKANEDDAIANTDAGDTLGDINLSNIQVDLSVIPNGNLRVGFLNGEDLNTSASTDTNRIQIFRVGVNGGIAENMFTYRAEYLQNMGKAGNVGTTGSGGPTELDYKGNAIDLGVGVNPPETSIGSFGLWLNYVMASGDDNTVDDKDDSFHDFTALGVGNTSGRHYGEIFGKSNTLGGGTPLGQGVNTADATGTAPNAATQGQGLTILNIGVNFKPAFMEKTWWRLDFFTFSRAEDSVKTSLTPGAAETKVGDKFGTEFDLTFGYDHTSNVGIELGYAMLNVDDALTGIGAVNDDAVTKLFARTNIRWGGEAAE